MRGAPGVPSISSLVFMGAPGALLASGGARVGRAGPIHGRGSGGAPSFASPLIFYVAFALLRLRAARFPRTRPSLGLGVLGTAVVFVVGAIGACNLTRPRGLLRGRCWPSRSAPTPATACVAAPVRLVPRGAGVDDVRADVRGRPPDAGRPPPSPVAAAVLRLAHRRCRGCGLRWSWLRGFSQVLRCSLTSAPS